VDAALDDLALRPFLLERAILTARHSEVSVRRLFALSTLCGVIVSLTGCREMALTVASDDFAVPLPNADAAAPSADGDMMALPPSFDLTVGCRNDDECPAGQACLAGGEEAACRSNVPDMDTCTSGGCNADAGLICRQPFACNQAYAGTGYVYSRCLPVCRDNADCPSWMMCAYDRCVPRRCPCPDFVSCDNESANTSCLGPGTGCHGDADCVVPSTSGVGYCVDGLCFLAPGHCAAIP